jgi:ABC-type amino acid transport system permease subunit
MKISLRDPLWQFIAAIVGILLLIITIYFYFLQRQYKELSFEIISNTPILSKAKEIADKIQLLYDGKPVNNVNLIIIKITNSGNIPIIRTDYERPIAFYFDSKSKVLDAEVIKTVPDDLKIKLNTSNDKIILEPVLLNEADSLTLKIILSEYNGAIRPDARILGIKAILDKTNKGKNSLLLLLLGFVLGFVLGFIIFLLFYILFRIAKVKISLTKIG